MAASENLDRATAAKTSAEKATGETLEELAVIGRFCAAMKLDWGGLDILRDRTDGRLYIVDVNKTDMPPLRLPWTQKMRAVAILSRALGDMVRIESARGRG